MKTKAKKRRKEKKTGRGRGRPPIYVKDKNGKEVVGLSYHKGTGTYYYTHFKKDGIRKTFGKNEDEAIRTFMLWDDERKEQEEYVVIPEDQTHLVSTEHYKDTGILPDILLRQYSKDIQNKWRGKMTVEASEEYGLAIPISFICKKARELILNKSLIEVRKLLDIPSLDFKSSEKPVALQTIGQIYFDRFSDDEREGSYIKGAKKHWAEFCDFTRAKTIKDLTIDRIVKYKNDIYALKEAKKWTHVSSINNRFSLIKTVFGNAVEQFVWYESQLTEIQTILTYLRSYLKEIEDQTEGLCLAE